MGNSNKGLGSDMDENKKHEIQSKGGQASHSGGRQSNSSNQNDQNQNSQSQSGQSSDSRGFEAMKEQGRDEEVSEIASLGGQSSHGGGRNREE